MLLVFSDMVTLSCHDNAIDRFPSAHRYRCAPVRLCIGTGISTPAHIRNGADYLAGVGSSAMPTGNGKKPLQSFTTTSRSSRSLIRQSLALTSDRLPHSSAPASMPGSGQSWTDPGPTTSNPSN
ncbi:hypothetical protein CJ178_16445 [Rhodococcus sp. ACPA4]|nr:hypothetical protein CJ178_16445 [Rhodococcus sp. ACPA4]